MLLPLMLGWLEKVHAFSNNFLYLGMELCSLLEQSEITMYNKLIIIIGEHCYSTGLCGDGRKAAKG